MINGTNILLQNIDSTASSAQYSEKKIGGGYYKNGDGVHTLYTVVNAFLGSITIQGTLEQYPSDDDTDWVEVNTFAGDSTYYNQPNNTDAVDYDVSSTFTGKFVWIRAKYELQNGTIREVRYNY
jgi:hypothetical protein